MIKTNQAYKMKRALLLAVFICLTQSNSFSQKKQTLPKKEIRRFFGIHLDFHADLSSKEVGKTLTEEMIDTMLTLVKPDFLQVDCKGHPGISSYPTTVGTPAPGILKDPLRMYRDVTAKHKIPLYVHYSGILDEQAVKLHPEWANINAKGEKDRSNTSLFSDYSDKLMIPQFKELISKYKIDGAWVDGDCWAAQPDYSPEAIAAFKKETGIANIPKSWQDEGYHEFMDFNRRKFRNYVAHYVDELHKFNPDFLITSNWAYSSMMPEKVDTNVDFLSGDMATRSYVSNAALEARCLAPQGKPWDLMAWGFTHDGPTGMGSYKSALQLEQEAAHVLSMGGGFQIYYPQNYDASIKTWQVKTMAELSKFCRDRQAFTEGAKAVPQIAVLHSTEGFKRKANGLYYNSGVFNAEQGILNALLDGQNTAEVLMEHHLETRMEDYKLIIIPEWDYLAPEFISKLKTYVTGGGNLLIIGAKAVKLFEKDLGVEFGEFEEKKKLQFGTATDMAVLNTDRQIITLKKSTKPFGLFYDEQDFRFVSGIAPATIAALGKGRIAGIFVDLGKNYLERQASVMREFLSGMVKELFPNPMLQVSGSHLVNVTLNKIGNKYAVNLINTAGAHANDHVYNYDEVPELGPLTINLRLDKKPSKVALQPGNQNLPFEFRDGSVKTVVPLLRIHSIVVVDP